MLTIFMKSGIIFICIIKALHMYITSNICLQPIIFCLGVKRVSKRQFLSVGIPTGFTSTFKYTCIIYLSFDTRNYKITELSQAPNYHNMGRQLKKMHTFVIIVNSE